MFNAWNNAPWTPRGRKVKNAVEAFAVTAFLFLAFCEPRSWK